MYEDTDYDALERNVKYIPWKGKKEERQQLDKVFIGNKKTKEKCTRIQITTPWRGTSSTFPGRERKRTGTPGIRHFWFVL